MATNILNISKEYNTQAKCLSYLEKLRWGKTVKCPFCHSHKIRRIKNQQGRYFWSYVKNGIRGNYKAISKKYLPFYLVEYEWKYNHRNFRGNEFEAFLKNALSHPKELYHWKAQSTKEVKEVAYGK